MDSKKEHECYFDVAKRLIFDPSFINLDYLSPGQKYGVVALILNFLSRIDRDDLVNAFEIKNLVLASLKESSFNDCELTYLSEDLFDVTCSIIDNIYASKCFIGKFHLVTLDDDQMVIEFKQDISRNKI